MLRVGSRRAQHFSSTPLSAFRCSCFCQHDGGISTGLRTQAVKFEVPGVLRPVSDFEESKAADVNMGSPKLGVAFEGSP